MPATVTLYTPAPAAPAPRRRKLKLVDDTGLAIELPFAPLGGTLAGLAPTWEEVARTAGRAPLLVNTGPALATLELEATVTDTRNPTGDAELYAYALTVMARRARRVFLLNYGRLVGNPWRIVDLNVEPFRRTAGNAVAGFTATISLKAAGDLELGTGPLTGGARDPQPPAAGRTIDARAGDTAASLAYRALGDTRRAGELLELNGIRNPRAIAAGDTYLVPSP